MQIIDNIALISINETLFVQLTSFLIFLFIINRIMFKPLQSIMGERNKYISDLRKGVLDAKEEMDSLIAQLEKRELKAKNEAFDLKKELENSGSEDASKLFSQTREKISVQTAKAENEINIQITEAKQTFNEESERLAIIIMEKVLDRRLTS